LTGFPRIPSFKAPTKGIGIMARKRKPQPGISEEARARLRQLRQEILALSDREADLLLGDLAGAELPGDYIMIHRGILDLWILCYKNNLSRRRFADRDAEVVRRKHVEKQKVQQIAREMKEQGIKSTNHVYAILSRAKKKVRHQS